MITNIIPAFRSIVDHTDNLRAVVASYRHEVDGSECLVVEPAGPPMLDDYGQCRRVELPTDNPFPQCELLNHGQSVASHPFHILRGCDFPFVPGWERAALEYFEVSGLPYFSGFDRVLQIDEPGSVLLRSAIATGSDWPEQLDGREGGAAWSKGGCIFCICKEAVEKVGPRTYYDAWMPDDVDYAHRCAVEYGYLPNAHVLPVKAYHLWHDTMHRESKRTEELRVEHKKRMAGYSAALAARRALRGGAK